MLQEDVIVICLAGPCKTLDFTELFRTATVQMHRLLPIIELYNIIIIVK